MSTGSSETTALSTTSSMCSTVLIFTSFLTFSGMSSMSLALSAGISTSFTLPLWAARIFSLSPPMGRTLPRSVISPVMAISLFTGFLVMALTMALAIAVPALGPSLGVAPSGT